MTTVESQVAVNEERIANALQKIQEHMENEDERWEIIMKQHADFDKRLKILEKTLSRFSGFVAGMLFVFSSLWAALTFLGKYWN